MLSSSGAGCFEGVGLISAPAHHGRIRKVLASLFTSTTGSAGPYNLGRMQAGRTGRGIFDALWALSVYRFIRLPCKIAAPLGCNFSCQMTLCLGVLFQQVFYRFQPVLGGRKFLNYVRIRMWIGLEEGLVEDFAVSYTFSH